MRILGGSLLLVLTFALAACKDTQPVAETPAPAPTPSGLTAGSHVFTAADGSQIPYDVAGSGDVTVVLVHCWMCDRSYWSNQVPVLVDRYRTLTLDLPGHGEASADRATWTVGGFGEDVAALLSELDLHDVVLVGHSMGGPVALRAAALSPRRVRGIVAVDTLHDAEFDAAAQLETFLAQFEQDYAGTCSSFMDAMFPESGVDEIKAMVLAKGCAAERRDVGLALMKDFGNIDNEAWFAAAGVPIRAINGPANPTAIETNRKYADFDAVILQGVGHFPHMTRPSEFNPLLLEAIAGILAAGPPAAASPSKG